MTCSSLPGRNLRLRPNRLLEFLTGIQKLKVSFFPVIMLATPQQAAGRVQSFSQEESCSSASGQQPDKNCTLKPRTRLQGRRGIVTDP